MASTKTRSEGFETHFKKLENLSAELQDNKINIDELVPRIKEALTSIKVCKEVLKETTSQLTEINSEFVELETSATAED